jgi:hypothetical protein
VPLYLVRKWILCSCKRLVIVERGIGCNKQQNFIKQLETFLLHLAGWRNGIASDFGTPDSITLKIAGSIPASVAFFCSHALRDAFCCFVAVVGDEAVFNIDV